MTLSKSKPDLEAFIKSLPPERQAELLAQVMLMAEVTRPPKMTEAETTIELFSNWLTKHGEASQTSRAYRNDVLYFARWKLGRAPEGDDLNSVDLNRIKVEDCDGYLAHLLSEESKGVITRATVRRRLASLKSFFKYAQDCGYILSSPISKTKMPSARKTAKARILSEGDVWAMLSEARKAVKDATTDFSKQQATRDWLVIKLLYVGAFRVSEIANLKWGQIATTEKGNGKINIIGKGDKERDVVIPANLLVHLQTSREGKNPSEPVFKSREGGTPICDRSIRRIVKKYAELAKLDRIPSPHWLRHSHATYALQNNAPVKVATQTLGHASASTLLDNYVHAGEEESSSFFVKAD